MSSSVSWFDTFELDKFQTIDWDNWSINKEWHNYFVSTSLHNDTIDWIGNIWKKYGGQMLLAASMFAITVELNQCPLHEYKLYVRNTLNKSISK